MIPTGGRKIIEIVPTCVPHDVRDLVSSAEKARSFTQKLHIDIDDGIMTAAMTWPFVMPGTFEGVTLTPIAGTEATIHLMTKDPRAIGTALAFAGATCVIGHIESFPSPSDARDALSVWQKSGAIEVGLSILLDTPLEHLKPVIDVCEIVQVMSVASIGLQGAPFDARAIARVQELHERYPHRVIAVDGGINENNIGELVKAGATRFGVGAALMRDPNPIDAYTRLKAAAENALK
jgi:ribulose-phosphate 3-epimerase